MRKLLLRIAILSACLFVLASIFDAQLSEVYAKFGDPLVVQDNVLFYLGFLACACLGLYLLKPLIGIVIFILLLVLLFLLFQMGVVHIFSFLV